MPPYYCLCGYLNVREPLTRTHGATLELCRTLSNVACACVVLVPRVEPNEV